MELVAEPVEYWSTAENESESTVAHVAVAAPASSLDVVRLAMRRRCLPWKT